MAFSFVQQTNQFTYPASGNPTMTMGGATTKGNLLVCMVQTTSGTPIVPDDGRNIWVPIITSPLAGGRGFIQAFYAVAQSTRTLTLNLYGVTGGTGNYYQATQNTLANAGGQLIEFSGNSQNPYVTAATATGTSTAPAASFVIGGTTDLILGFAIGSAGNTVIETAGWTNAAGAGTSTSGIYQIENTSGTFTPTFLQSASAAWGCLAVAFQTPGTTYTISGNLGSNGAGATVTFLSQTTGQSFSTTANGSGNYTSPALENDTYIIQPQLLGSSFTPNALSGVAVSGSNVTGQNFTSQSVPTNLTFVQTVADSMQRANENPLSNGGTWAADGTPVPPWDKPLAIVSNEAVSSNAAIFANFSGPYSGNGISCWQNNAGIIPGSQYAQFQVDACNATPTAHASWMLGTRQLMNDTQGYYLFGNNNGDGTTTLNLYTILNSGNQPTNPGGLGNLFRVPFGRNPWAYWTKTVPFSLGDTFGTAVIGNTVYILHNGAVIGTLIDYTAQAIGTAVIEAQCQTASDVQLSHFTAGTAYVTGAQVTDIVDIGRGSASGTTLVTSSFPTSTGDGIVAFVSYYKPSGQTISSVKDGNGNSLSLAGTISDTNETISCYYLSNSQAISANTITATFSASVTFCDLCVFHVPGGLTSGFFDKVATASSTSSASSLTPTITTANANEVVFAYAFLGGLPAGGLIPVATFPTAWSCTGSVPQAYLQGAAAWQIFNSVQTSLAVPIQLVATNTESVAMLAAFNISASSSGGGSGSSVQAFRSFINKKGGSHRRPQ